MVSYQTMHSFIMHLARVLSFNVLYGYFENVIKIIYRFNIGGRKGEAIGLQFHLVLHRILLSRLAPT